MLRLYVKVISHADVRLSEAKHVVALSLPDHAMITDVVDFLVEQCGIPFIQYARKIYGNICYEGATLESKNCYTFCQFANYLDVLRNDEEVVLKMSIKVLGASPRMAVQGRATKESQNSSVVLPGAGLGGNDRGKLHQHHMDILHSTHNLGRVAIEENTPKDSYSLGNSVSRKRRRVIFGDNPGKKPRISPEVAGSEQMMQKENQENDEEDCRRTAIMTSTTTKGSVAKITHSDPRFSLGVRKSREDASSSGDSSSSESGKVIDLKQQKPLATSAAVKNSTNQMEVNEESSDESETSHEEVTVQKRQDVPILDKRPSDKEESADSSSSSSESEEIEEATQKKAVHGMPPRKTEESSDDESEEGSSSSEEVPQPQDVRKKPTEGSRETSRKCTENEMKVTASKVHDSSVQEDALVKIPDFPQSGDCGWRPLSSLEFDELPKIHDFVMYRAFRV